MPVLLDQHTRQSPDDEHWVARNMYRSKINALKKCVKLEIKKNYFVTVFTIFTGHSLHPDKYSPHFP